MLLEEFNKIYQLATSGASYKDLARELGFSASYMCRLLYTCRAGTYEQVKRILVDCAYKRYSLEELIDIAETIFTKRISLAEASILYQFEYNRVANLLRLRKQKGRKLTIEDLNFQWAQAYDAFAKRKPELTLPVAAFRTPYSLCIPSTDLTKAELKALQPKKPIFGRARAIPKTYRPAKINRNRQHVLAEKQQKQIAEIIKQAENAIISTEQIGSKMAEDTKATKTSKRTTIFKGYPASQFLDENGNCTLIGKRGRLPYVNPDSPGFDKMPDNVRLYSMQRSREDLQIENEFLKKAIALTE